MTKEEIIQMLKDDLNIFVSIDTEGLVIKVEANVWLGGEYVCSSRDVDIISIPTGKE